MSNAEKGSLSKETPRAASQASMRKTARTMALTAMKTLQEIMDGDGQTSVRLAAAREVLDRGYGRAGAAEPEAAKAAGMTVIVRKFTPPPANKADGGEVEA